MTFSLRSLGLNCFMTTLLTVASELIRCFNPFGIDWTTERVSQRYLIASVQDLRLLPYIVALRVCAGAVIDQARCSAISMIYRDRADAGSCKAIRQNWRSGLRIALHHFTEASELYRNACRAPSRSLRALWELRLFRKPM